MSITNNMSSNENFIVGQITSIQLYLLLVTLIIGMCVLLYGIRKKRKHYIGLGIALVIGNIITAFVLDYFIRDTLLAFASIVAVLLAGYSLYQTYQLRKDAEAKEKRERKERLLNEIIEWAENVYKCGLDPLSSPTKEEAKNEAGCILYLINLFSQLLLTFDSISIRSEYISNIANIFGKNLKRKINDLDKIIRIRIKFIELQLDILNGKKKNLPDTDEFVKIDAFKEWISSQHFFNFLSQDFRVTMFKIMMNRTVLVDSARQIIEDATILKTEDIG